MALLHPRTQAKVTELDVPRRIDEDVVRFDVSVVGVVGGWGLRACVNKGASCA